MTDTGNLPLRLARGSDDDVAQAGRPDQGAFHDAVSFSGTAATSDPVPDGVVLVRLVAVTELCYYRINAKGASTAATSGSIPLPPNVIEYVRVEPGDAFSVIQSSSGGVLSITAVK